MSRSLGRVLPGSSPTALLERSGLRLDALHQRLAHLDEIEVEFAPQRLGGGPIRHMMIRAAGGLRLEFIAVGA